MTRWSAVAWAPLGWVAVGWVALGCGLTACADGASDPEFRQYVRDAEITDARVLASDLGPPRVDMRAGQPEPVEVTVEAWPEARILAHDAQGTLVDDTDGTATLGSPYAVTIFDAPAGGRGRVVTILEPRAAVTLVDPTDDHELAWPASIQLPGAADGATSYDITLGCVGVRWVDPMVAFDAMVPKGCLTSDGVAWVLALALDEADRPIAFTQARIPGAPDAPVNLGPWRQDFARHTIEVDGMVDAHALWGREHLTYGILGRKQGEGAQFFDLARNFGGTHWGAEVVFGLPDPPLNATLRAWVAPDEDRIRLDTEGLGPLDGGWADGTLTWTAPEGANSVRIDAVWATDEVQRQWSIFADPTLGTFTPPTVGIPREWRPPDDATWYMTAVRCAPAEGFICPSDAIDVPDTTPHTGWRITIGL